MLKVALQNNQNVLLQLVLISTHSILKTDLNEYCVFANVLLCVVSFPVPSLTDPAILRLHFFS
jgi:hypothetical protein